MGFESRDEKIQDLKDELLVLASMVEQMTRHAIDALLQRKLDDSQRIYDYDQQVNQKHLAIETRCLDLIAKDPPILALDLRLLASLLEVNTEIERIGDSAKGIAKISMETIFEPAINCSEKINRVTEKILDRFHLAIGAFVSRDKQTSLSILQENFDFQVLFTAVKMDILKLLIETRLTNPSGAKYFYLVHTLERINDHVINICKRTLYLEKGSMPTLEYKLEKMESS